MHWPAHMDQFPVLGGLGEFTLGGWESVAGGLFGGRERGHLREAEQGSIGPGRVLAKASSTVA